MAVTTTQSIVSLVKKLVKDFPDLRFERGQADHWSPDSQTVHYKGDALMLIHEVSHALLKHRRYTRDVELLGMERDAWLYARQTLGPRYNVIITQDVIENALDSYRDWLHARSTCPNCHASGVEARKSMYHCLACGQMWKVNEARICHLRRYQIQK